MDREGILNSTQIGLSRECSIWIAHAIFENLIRKSIKAEELSALVTLGVAKAYDSLEHSINMGFVESGRAGVSPFFLI